MDNMSSQIEKFNGKKIMIVGLGVTGVSLVHFFFEQKAAIIINDLKSRNLIEPTLRELEPVPYTGIFGKHPDTLKEAGNPDYIVLSPGVPLELPFIQEAIHCKVPILGEIEVAYQQMDAPIAAITGTNGKTTTTALLGDMARRSGIKHEIVGNIGTAAISKVKNLREDAHCIMEVSSFQLETINEFKPKVAALLNITPDHLNRHKSIEHYTDLKFKIFSNQKPEDVAVINAEDDICKRYMEGEVKIESEILFFSRFNSLEKGVFIKDGKMIVQDEQRSAIIIDCDNILLPGDHNLENAMAAVGIAWSMNFPLDAIRESLESFRGVEHRIELVETINDITFINDSKATNPAAAIKAVISVSEPIILLAGGMDKGNDFTDLINAFDGRVKQMIVYGETADKIANRASELEFNNVIKTDDLEQAFRTACKSAATGDLVLLSPACASFDMYDNYEARGNHFKSLVHEFKLK